MYEYARYILGRLDLSMMTPRRSFFSTFDNEQLFFGGEPSARDEGLQGDG